MWGEKQKKTEKVDGILPGRHKSSERMNEYERKRDGTEKKK